MKYCRQEISYYVIKYPQNSKSFSLYSKPSYKNLQGELHILRILYIVGVIIVVVQCWRRACSYSDANHGCESEVVDSWNPMEILDTKYEMLKQQET